MAYPATIPQTTVTIGTAVDWWSDPVSLVALVTPILGGQAKKITHAETGTPMLATSKTFKSQSGGYLEFSVPSSDPTGWRDGSGNEPGPWSYHVQITATFADKSTHVWPKSFKPLPGQDAIDLDLIEDGVVIPGTSAPVPAVTSINGMTGAVTLDAGTVDLSEYVTTEAFSDGLAGKVNTSTYSTLSNRVTTLEQQTTTPYDDTDIVSRVSALEGASAPSYKLVENPAGSGLYELQAV